MRWKDWRAPRRDEAWPPCTLQRLPSPQPGPQARWVDIKQEAYVSEGEWAVAWRAQEPFPRFIELTSAAGPRSIKVGLEDMHGINQDGHGQPAKGVHPGYVPAAGEKLSRQDALALVD